MDKAERDKLIETYKDGYRVVAQALVGATDEEIDMRPAPGKWSTREIVHHLADSELIAAARLRMLVVVDAPQIVGYNQDDMARRLYYDRSIEASVDLFKATRRSTAELLERMSEADWAKEGMHTQTGRYTAVRWLEIYAAHAHKHAEQILVARDAARKAKVAENAVKQ